MGQLKPIHFLFLAMFAAGTFFIIASNGNLLGGLLASSAIVAFVSLLWTHPRARAFLQQHERLLNLITGVLILLVLAGIFFLPSSHPLRQSISAIQAIATVAMIILHFIPEYPQK